MANDWVSAGQTLQELAARFRDLGGLPLDEWRGLDAKALAQSMRLAEARTRLECDAIMRALLRSPVGAGRPTPLQSYFCSMRVLCALDTLGLLHAELPGKGELYPQPPKGWSDEQLLEWLLVSNWQHRHDTWVKLCALCQATGLGLYSG